MFVSPVLTRPSSTNRRVDHFHPTQYLSHLPAGILYCMPLRKIITQRNHSEGFIGAPYVSTIFHATELSSIYFSSIAVFHDISKQTQKRARVGKIFARWHLVIAITSRNIFYNNIEAEICEIYRMF